MIIERRIARFIAGSKPTLVRRSPQRAAEIKQCHTNCKIYAHWAAEQGLNYRQVIGWMDTGEGYAAHSVVDCGPECGGLICITPRVDNPPFILFIPDPHLHFVDAGDGFADLHRDGKPCPIDILPNVVGKMVMSKNVGPYTPITTNLANRITDETRARIERAIEKDRI